MAKNNNKKCFKCLDAYVTNAWVELKSLLLYGSSEQRVQNEHKTEHDSVICHFHK